MSEDGCRSATEEDGIRSSSVCRCRFSWRNLCRSLLGRRTDVKRQEKAHHQIGQDHQGKQNQPLTALQLPLPFLDECLTKPSGRRFGRSITH
jgi:hypothetical protein